jgi:hypothetical protein
MRNKNIEVSVFTVAVELMVSPEAIYRLIRLGKVRPVNTNPIRVTVNDVAAALVKGGTARKASGCERVER